MFNVYAKYACFVHARKSIGQSIQIVYVFLEVDMFNCFEYSKDLVNHIHIDVGHWFINM